MTGRTELNNIMPLRNIPSVLQRGILSHQRASELDHADISLEDVQNIRDGVTLPNGRALHSFANLYFDARNPMMYKRRAEYNELCILRISTEVATIPGTYVSSQNASSKYARFYDAANVSSDDVDMDKVYARDWDHEDEIEKWQHASIKCAEVLVPNSIPPEYILGAYVATEQAKQQLLQRGFDKQIEINADKFFR